MKKVFALVLCLILVVACFSGCGNREERFVYEEGSPEGGFYHSLGNLTKLDVGVYSVKHFWHWGEETLEARFLIVSENKNSKPYPKEYVIKNPLSDYTTDITDKVYEYYS